MGKVAFLFSGQGAQYPGMGHQLYQTSPAARELLDRLDGVRPGLLNLCFRADAGELARTENTQPAVYAVDLAAASRGLELGLRPVAAAGFSLGEVAALAFAGAFSPEEGLELVIQRAAFMAEAAARRPGAMLAVLRLEAAAVEALCQGRELYPVNYNAPGQLVVAGIQEEIDLLALQVKEAGGRSVRLPLAGAFHSPLMDQAAASLAAHLKGRTFGHLQLPVIANRTAAPYGADVGGELAAQIHSPVRFQATIQQLADDGVTCFVEAGPGKTLTGFVSRIVRGATAFSLEEGGGDLPAACLADQKEEDHV